MPLKNKTALVTGGTRGIGKTIAERLAREGCKTIVSGRNIEIGKAFAHSISGEFIELDVANRTSIESACEKLETTPIDILINNAGIAESEPLAKTSDALWDAILATNLTSVFLLCRAIIPRMISQDWGRVINIASNAGLTGYAYSSAYCASKHGVVGLTRAIASEIGATNVTINAICPGWVHTDMALQSVQKIAKTTGKSEQQAQQVLERMSPQRRMIEPNEIAELVTMLCHDNARGIHGQAIAIDGGQVMK